MQHSYPMQVRSPLKPPLVSLAPLAAVQKSRIQSYRIKKSAHKESHEGLHAAVRALRLDDRLGQRGQGCQFVRLDAPCGAHVEGPAQGPLGRQL